MASAETRRQRGSRGADAADAARGAHTNRGAAVAAADSRRRRGSEHGAPLPRELRGAATHLKEAAAAKGSPQPASRAARGACSPQARLVAVAQLRCSEGAAHLDLCLQTQAGSESLEAAAAANARPAPRDSPSQAQDAPDSPGAPAAGGAAEPELPGQGPGTADSPADLGCTQGQQDAGGLQQWPQGLETQGQEALPGHARGQAAHLAAEAVVSVEMAVPDQTQNPEYLPHLRPAAATAAGRRCRGPRDVPGAQQDSAGEARQPPAGRLRQKAGSALHGTKAGPGLVPAEQQGGSGGPRQQAAGRLHQMAPPAGRTRGEQPGSGGLQRKPGSRLPAGVPANMPAAGALPPGGKAPNPQAAAKAAVAALLRAQNAAASDAFA